MTQVSSDAIRLSIDETKIKATAMGIRIGIGNRIKIGGGGQSWESYWASQPEVLFFGLYSEISGGQMPNRKSGSSDYLTVAGVAGSETYQCPNTAPYIAADTDYIWFKTDESQRTVTTAELIGYDLQRTPVKYEDASPNEIVAILILNTDLSAEKLLKLHHDFRLPIMWSGYWVDEGYSKSNRPIEEQILWTPEPIATFLDTFTGEDGALLSAHMPDSANFFWTNATYIFDILGNKTRYNGTGANATAYMNTVNKADVDMSIDLTIPDEDYYLGGLILHRQSSSYNWRIGIVRSTGGAPLVRIQKYTTTVHSIDVTHVVGVRTLRVVSSGAFMTVYLDNAKVIDNYESDGDFSANTQHGFYGYKDASYKEILYDNFKIL